MAYALPKTEWGLINQLVINEFVKKAYLQDFYFNTDLKSLVLDSFIPTLVEQYENSAEENKWIMLELASRLKTGKCLKIINNELIWDVEKTPSLYLYIHNLIQKLPYKPIPESKRIILENKLEPKTGLEWINKVLDFTKEYSYQELEMLFQSLFKEHGLIWNKNNSIKLYFPKHISKRKQKNGKKETYYKFNNF